VLLDLDAHGFNNVLAILVQEINVCRRLTVLLLQQFEASDVLARPEQRLRQHQYNQHTKEKS
jgi:hypothetical protein